MYGRSAPASAKTNSSRGELVYTEESSHTLGKRKLLRHCPTGPLRRRVRSRILGQGGVRDLRSIVGWGSTLHRRHSNLGGTRANIKLRQSRSQSLDLCLKITLPPPHHFRPRFPHALSRP